LPASESRQVPAAPLAKCGSLLRSRYWRTDACIARRIWDGRPCGRQRQAAAWPVRRLPGRLTRRRMRAMAGPDIICGDSFVGNAGRPAVARRTGQSSGIETRWQGQVVRQVARRQPHRYTERIATSARIVGSRTERKGTFGNSQPNGWRDIDLLLVGTHEAASWLKGRRPKRSGACFQWLSGSGISCTDGGSARAADFASRAGVRTLVEFRTIECNRGAGVLR